MRGSVMTASSDVADRDKYIGRVQPAHWRNPAPQALYDLVIVGAGPAGLAAARTARDLNLSVALIERSRLGGNSSNVGSVPSKTIICTSRAVADTIDGGEFGAPASDNLKVNIGDIMRRIRRIRTRIAEYHSAERLRAEGIDVFFGNAHFVGARSIEAGDAFLSFKKALIATGARPRAPTIPGLDSVGYCTDASIFDIKELPRRLAVIGGGPLGCELAQAFAGLGSHVTILQKEPKFLPHEERDAAEILSQSMSRCGVETRLNTPMVGARMENGEKVIEAQNNDVAFSIVVDEILLSIGRVANTEDLDLPAGGIALHSTGRVEVDDFLCTTNPNVYAAGDVCMSHQFTNVAEATARMAVSNAFSDSNIRHSQMIIPWCTYCDPEIAHIGIYTREARSKSIPVKSFTIMMQDVDRAITDGRDTGFVKIHVREGSDQIAGATVVGSRAGEMINEISVLMNAGIGMRQLATILHTYPSQSDAIRLAAIAYAKSGATGAGRAPQRALLESH